MKTLLEMRGINNNVPNKILVHHTGGTDANPLADTSHHTFETIQSWHINGRGWENIGYHWVIEKNGRVVAGRPENYYGAHEKSENRTSVGVVLTGNFDATLPTKEQEDSLRTLLSEIMERHNIDKENIFPHRHFKNKTCYGNLLSDTWARELLDSDSHSIRDHSEVEILSEAISILTKYTK